VIHYGRHEIDEDDIAAVVDVLRGDWLTTGPAVATFEQDISDCIGGSPVVALSNGTAALHAAYASIGIGAGDEVITPPITFVATQAAAMHLGATPVFADVLPDTITLDPAAVRAALSKRTKAIVAVDYAGHPAEIDELREIADSAGLPLIEDAAHSLGSTYRGRAVGSMADLTTFSFYPTKNITTGEGGAVAGLDFAVIERARRFARQGLVRNDKEFVIDGQGAWHQEVHSIGLNYRLPDVLAALGSRQIAKLDRFKAKRAEIKARYDAALGGHAAIQVPIQRDYVDPVWHLYPLRVAAESRSHVFRQLRDQNIMVQVNYLPAYWHPALSHLAARGSCPNAEAFYASEISLPMHTQLHDDDIDFVCDVVLAAVGND
jgi:dTDP-4-amino-4,6-dideoxygalactose transaminase